MDLWIHEKFGVDSVLWIKPPRDRFLDPSVIILSLLYIYIYCRLFRPRVVSRLLDGKKIKTLLEVL